MDIDTLHIQYQDHAGRAERLREAVVVQLSALLAANDVTLGVPMESRVKAWASLAEKMDRKQLTIESLFDLHDLVGVRAILLFRSDLAKVIELIKSTFDVVSLEDTAARLGDSEFGYQSQHFVVRLPKSWLLLPSLAGFNDFCVELQVRTIAQHIWAAASHKLQYKQESGVPRPLRRTINRVSALLETVDLEFERVLDERRAYLQNSHTPQAATEPLNVDSLAALLTELLPTENKKENEPYADLLSDLIELKIETPEQLRVILNKHAEQAKNSDRKRVAELRADSAPPYEPDQSERLARGVFYAHVGLVREALRAEYGDGVANAVFAERMKLNRKRTKQPTRKRMKRRD
jgi:ppGpp synthetase/RelA/SpoT-type nucleotidyltranferase